MANRYSNCHWTSFVVYSQYYLLAKLSGIAIAVNRTEYNPFIINAALSKVRMAKDVQAAVARIAADDANAACLAQADF